MKTYPCCQWSRNAAPLVAAVVATLVIGSAGAQTSDSDSRWRTAHHPTLVEFDPPGTMTTVSAICAPACGTTPEANNAAGDIVGTYTDEYVVPHGFIRHRDGRFTSFDAPAAGLGANLNEGTVPLCINDRGEIAGQYEDPNLLYYGFIRYRDGSFLTVDASTAALNPGQGTFITSINADGATAGYVIDANGQHGFLRTHHGTITDFDPTGSVQTYVCEEACINRAGIVTGFYLDANTVFHAYLRDREGNITTFDAPGASSKVPYGGTVAVSVDAEGVTAGYVVDDSNVAHGWIRHRDGQFTLFDDPSAATGPGQGTVPYSANMRRQVTGIISDANNGMHGFFRSAHGRFITIDAPDAATGPFTGTRPSTINSEGEVTGWYFDATGLSHGFLWKP